MLSFVPVSELPTQCFDFDLTLSVSLLNLSLEIPPAVLSTWPSLLTGAYALVLICNAKEKKTKKKSLKKLAANSCRKQIDFLNPQPKQDQNAHIAIGYAHCAQHIETLCTGVWQNEQHQTCRPFRVHPLWQSSFGLFNVPILIHSTWEAQQAVKAMTGITVNQQFQNHRLTAWISDFL